MRVLSLVLLIFFIPVVVFAVVPTPENLTVESRDEENYITWDTVPGADGYILYRDGSELVDTDSTGITHFGLNNGQTYVYQVTAYDSDGESPLSGFATGTPESPFNSVENALLSGIFIMLILMYILPRGARA